VLGYSKHLDNLLQVAALGSRNLLVNHEPFRNTGIVNIAEVLLIIQQQKAIPAREVSASPLLVLLAFLVDVVSYIKNNIDRFPDNHE
jgi:hypothetical protein